MRQSVPRYFRFGWLITDPFFFYLIVHCCRSYHLRDGWYGCQILGFLASIWHLAWAFYVVQALYYCWSHRSLMSCSLCSCWSICCSKIYPYCVGLDRNRLHLGWYRCQKLQSPLSAYTSFCLCVALSSTFSPQQVCRKAGLRGVAALGSLARSFCRGFYRGWYKPSCDRGGCSLGGGGLLPGDSERRRNGACPSRGILAGT